VSASAIEIGEGFAGDGVDAAHVNTVLGPRDGPVGAAWATGLATPSAGHAAFVVVAAPNLPVQPMTLFVNKATIAGDRHGTLTWGAAQAGVAAGVLAALHDGVIDRARVSELVLIAAVWVNPDAGDATTVYRNNEAATRGALGAGREHRPTIEQLLAVSAPSNPYFRS
jgi:5,6,7,8-tetrahydromethanopterin hydro-lyase